MSIKKAMYAAAAAAVLSAGVAHADTLALPGVPNAETGVPGSFDSIFYSNAADSAAKLTFVLQGYRTLDAQQNVGVDNGWTDRFTLNFNSIDIGTGFFRLGGGGTSDWTWSGTTGETFCTTCNQAQNNVGGTVSFANVVLNTKVGANTVSFRYTGANEGFNNEGWRISSGQVTSFATVSAVPEPESLAMMLAGLGLMGTIARRRKAKQA